MSGLANYTFTGGTAVLTGAASGMGEQMAHQLADKGSNLALIDRDAVRLSAVTDAIRSRHADLDVTAYVVDLVDTSAIDDLAARVLADHPRVTLLINNAGVGLGGRFDQLTAEEFDWLIAINFQAPVAMTRAFLPTLKKSTGSHIVNVSSLFGLIAPPGQTAYAASKFAIRGFSESLRHELADDGIGVTTIHPGGINTRIAESSRHAASITDEEAAAGKEAFSKLLTYPADKAAAQILSGVEHRKGRVLIAVSAVVPDLLARLFPASYLKVMGLLSPSTARNATKGSTGDRQDA